MIKVVNLIISDGVSQIVQIIPPKKTSWLGQTLLQVSTCKKVWQWSEKEQTEIVDSVGKILIELIIK
jgi:hypothetical protein